MVLAGLVVAALAFWNWRSADRIAADSLHASEAAQEPAGRPAVSERAVEPVVVEELSSLSSAQTPLATPGATAASSTLPDALEALLQSPNHRPRMRKVPPLSEAETAELIQRYAATDSITNKYRIARILAFAGSTQAVSLFTTALTEEFSRRSVTTSEQAMLLHLPELLGLLAGKDDQALDFLIRGCTAEFWRATEYWYSDGGRIPDSVWAAQCIQGLALSGRPESKALLDRYRDDPSLAARLQIGSAMVDAAFLSDLMREHGPMKTMDDYLNDPEDAMRYFGLWKGTTNGIWWDEWRHRVNRLERSLARPP